MDKNNYVRAVPIREGVKLFMQNKEACLTMEKKLNEFGIKTRARQNCEIDLWSIYIISVPDNLTDITKEVGEIV